MDLSKTGQIIYKFRKEKGMTQKQVADQLGILPKTVSKWETGKGFPDVSVLAELADVLGISERMLLSGNLIQNKKEPGNMKNIKFYVCPYCGSIAQGLGECEVMCCGKKVKPLLVKQSDDEHSINVSKIETDFYVEISHDMLKEHYISFFAYVGFDRSMLIKLYPEQEPSFRIPGMFRGKCYFYCNNHGLFEYNIKK